MTEAAAGAAGGEEMETGLAQVGRCLAFPDESPFVQVINEQVRFEGGYLSEVVVVSGLTGAMANKAMHTFKEQEEQEAHHGKETDTHGRECA